MSSAWVLTASAVVLTAGYILWTVQRVYLGPEYKGQHGDHLHDLELREWIIAVPLVLGAIWFGIYPQSLLKYMQPSVDAEVEQLADWAKRNGPAPIGPAKAAVADSVIEPIAPPVATVGK